MKTGIADTKYLNRGDFQKINNSYLLEGFISLSDFSKFQKKYDKYDSDSIINELHDSLTGFYLGFDLFNSNKHGFDCKRSGTPELFLEVKAVSFEKGNITATFNDTNDNKANAFRDGRVWLALSVWTTITELLFIVYGQNELIGDYLGEKVIAQTKASKRRTQSIGMNALIEKYDFKILSISKSKEELTNILNLKYPWFKKCGSDRIVELKDFQSIDKDTTNQQSINEKKQEDNFDNNASL